MKLLPIPGKQAQLSYIKKLAKSSEWIINGCDSGREGEAIFQFVLEFLQIQKPVKRLWTSSLTVEAIRKAFAEMKDGRDYSSLYQAARSRAEADWIIGLNGTRVFTCKHHDKFTVGRVQTPTLAILADRQQEIDHFVEEDFYEVEVLFSQVGQDFKGIWQGPQMKDRSKAETIVQMVSGQIGTITSYEKKEEKNNPPKLYDLNLLQKEANAKFGFTADKTLKTAQKLYERKNISYPRTNSNYVDQTNIPFMYQAFDLLKKTTYAPLTAKGDKKYVHINNKHICRPDKIEDHHAILPTENIPRTFGTKDDEKLYDLIVKRFLAHFFPPAVYRVHIILVDVKGEPFKTTVKALLQSGWKVVNAEESDEDPLVENFSLGPSQFVGLLKF
ncbi:DNA topoisomerase IA [Ammoniphilus resinae]|uniref:DNA topoisomerase n=1 Tax=Ammoniphilus resinae TaxID=861532 RepID=A0ABS4GPY8_9BACL|nr:DNA topoisomerase IA [Ammoniphilus resinae]